VNFSSGLCRLSADEDRLTLEVSADSGETIATLRDVVERHLVRFAFREDLTLAWTAPG
jgi:hypothetical protein